MNQQSQCTASSSVSTTQQKLMHHFGPSLHPKISQIISKDVDELESPMAQNTTDVYHQSGAKTWQQFVDNSSIRTYNPNKFMALQYYQTQFTKYIYSPLLLYTSSIRRYLFEGKANTLLHQIHQIYNHLKTITIPSNGVLHMDFRSFHNISMDCESDNDELGEWHCDYIDDIQYESKDNCNIQNNSLYMHPYELDKDMNNILKQYVMNGKCNYKRFELTLNEKQIKLIEPKTNNTVPDIKSIKNAPLCLIFNSISSYKNNPLDVENMASINISFHVSSDNISIYIYVADGDGKLYGQKICKTADLLTVIPLLFEDKSIDEYIRYELENLQFIPDTIYDKYYASIINIHRMDRPQVTFLTDVEDFINGLNEGKVEDIIDVSIIKQCFIKHNINHSYFIDKNHKRKHLIKLLNSKPYNIKAGIICKIWNEFNNKQSTEYNEDAIIQNSMEHQQYLENEHRNNMEEIKHLRQQLRNEREQFRNLQRVVQVARNDMNSVNVLGDEMTYLNLFRFHNFYTRMVEQVSFVLWLLYWYMIYKKLNVFNAP